MGSAAFTSAAATAGRVRGNRSRYDESASGAWYLNTPRLVADATGTTVWRWDQADPFGDSPADENPGGAGTFDLPLRLPGQYYDAASGLFQNVRRDFNPGIGQYLQFDPLGILPYRQPEKRLNDAYAYAKGDPLRKVDPFGLCSCKGGHWTQGSNLAFGLMLGGGAQFSSNAIFTCNADSSLQCKANVVCIGGGLMVSGGIGADLSGDVYGAFDSGDLSSWSSGLAGSAGPVSGIGFFGGGGNVSLMKGFGGGIA